MATLEWAKTGLFLALFAFATVVMAAAGIITYPLKCLCDCLCKRR